MELYEFKEHGHQNSKCLDALSSCRASWDGIVQVQGAWASKFKMTVAISHFTEAHLFTETWWQQWVIN
jgi:hypothetical protein